MSEKTLDLSILRNLLNNFLERTEEVKITLQEECNEAKFVLKPWKLETSRIQEIDESSCSCTKVSQENEEATEIANAIEKTLIQAQQLREKLAGNLAKEKKRSREPGIRSIYTSGPKSTSNQRKVPSLHKDKSSNLKLRSSKFHSRLDGKENAKNSSPEQSKKKEYLVKKISPQKQLGNEFKLLSKKNVESDNNEKKAAVSPKVGKASPFAKNEQQMKIRAKKPVQKNFIAANKSSIKTLQREKQMKATSKTDLEKKKSVGFEGVRKLCFAPTTSSVHLNTLMAQKEVRSWESTKSISSSCPDIARNECPFHGINAVRFSEEKTVTVMDAVEGIDRFGIPPELAKDLKIYHSYLRKEFHEDLENDRKSQKAAKKFLSEFHLMNEIQQERCNNSLSNVTMKFVDLFGEVLLEDIGVEKLKELKLKYRETESWWQTSSYPGDNDFKLDPDQWEFGMTKKNYARETDLYTKRSRWAGNGIWNDSSISNFEGMSKASCIRYYDKNQLLTLFHTWQKLQQKQFLKNLVELLLEEVIPMLKKNLDPTGKDYVEMYKMMIIMSQGLNPRMPILIKTEDK